MSAPNLLLSPRGNFLFLPGGDTFSNGVIAEEGYEIHHVALTRLIPYREGFQFVERWLKEQGRDRHALCGVELRSPAPFSRTGFVEFNAQYRVVLDEWELAVEGRHPVARTNVAPERHPPSEVSLAGFSYTVPHPAGGRKSFIVSGVGEMRGGPVMEAAVIRPGETSEEAMREKAAYVMESIERRLEGLGVTWDAVTATSLYSVQPMDELVRSSVLDRIGSAVHRGLRWHHARPPLIDLKFEMDARGTVAEFYIDLG